MNGSCRGIMEYKIGKMMDNGGQLSSQSPHFLAGDRSGPPTEPRIIPRALILSSAPVTKSTIPAGPSHQSGTSVISADLFIFTDPPPFPSQTYKWS